MGLREVISLGEMAHGRSFMFCKNKLNYINNETTDVWVAGCRAVALSISRWILTAVAWVRTRFCSGQSGTGSSFLRVL
jgi:hypothetical protein